MKIGILSDTHHKPAYSQRTIAHLIKEGAEFLIHAGDIGEKRILEQLSESGLRYVAVYGNNDAALASYHNLYNLVQEPHYFKLAGTTFKLMHLPFYMTPDAEVVVFGHTHTFECDYKERTLFINPGETCARNKNSSECLLLDVSDNRFGVTYYTRNPDSEAFIPQHFSFERHAHE